MNTRIRPGLLTANTLACGSGLRNSRCIIFMAHGHRTLRLVLVATGWKGRTVMLYWIRARYLMHGRRAAPEFSGCLALTDGSASGTLLLLHVLALTML